jgi:hypothetical protein
MREPARMGWPKATGSTRTLLKRPAGNGRASASRSVWTGEILVEARVLSARWLAQQTARLSVEMTW